MKIIKRLLCIASTFCLGYSLLHLFQTVNLSRNATVSLIVLTLLFAVFVLPQVVDTSIDWLVESWNNLPRDRMTNGEIAIIALGSTLFFVGGPNQIIWLAAIGFTIAIGWPIIAAIRCWDHIRETQKSGNSS